jgi:hypothetical protein
MFTVAVLILVPYVSEVVQAAAVTAIATVIAVTASYLTNRASAKAQAQVASSTSRTDIEKEAFARAEKYYQGVIADQDRREEDRAEELRAAKNEAHEARREAHEAKEQARGAVRQASACSQRLEQYEAATRRQRIAARKIAKVLSETGLADQYAELQTAVLAFIADQNPD